VAVLALAASIPLPACQPEAPPSVVLLPALLASRVSRPPARQASMVFLAFAVQVLVDLPSPLVFFVSIPRLMHDKPRALRDLT
jgi:hypothetical protein